jgi:hypothetical protein
MHTSVDTLVKSEQKTRWNGFWRKALDSHQMFRSKYHTAAISNSERIQTVHSISTLLVAAMMLLLHAAITVVSVSTWAKEATLTGIAKAYMLFVK